MTLDLTTIKKGKNLRPPRIVIYGTAKCGKSTFASSAPNPIFLDLEDGLDNIETSSQRITTYPEFEDALTALFEQAHNFETLVIDSADWLETLIFTEVAKNNNVKSIEDLGYGKGYIYALAIWKDILNGLTELRNKKNMGVIIICHDKVRTYNNPMGEGYDRYSLKLHDAKNTSTVDLVKEWADCIFFAKDKENVTKEGNAVSVGRKLYTTETPAFLAGNRYNLPKELPLSWDAFMDAFNKSITTGESK